MKKFSKLLLVLLLCFTFIGCSNKKNTAEITKLLKDAGYTVKYNKDDYTTITISESKSGKDKSQYIAYVEKDEISSIAFIQLPEDSQNYDDMKIGYIYANEKSDAQVDITFFIFLIHLILNFLLTKYSLCKQYFYSLK